MRCESRKSSFWQVPYRAIFIDRIGQLWTARVALWTGSLDPLFLGSRLCKEYDDAVVEACVLQATTGLPFVPALLHDRGRRHNGGL